MANVSSVGDSEVDQTYAWIGSRDGRIQRRIALYA